MSIQQRAARLATAPLREAWARRDGLPSTVRGECRTGGTERRYIDRAAFTPRPSRLLTGQALRSLNRACRTSAVRGNDSNVGWRRTVTTARHRVLQAYLQGGLLVNLQEPTRYMSTEKRPEVVKRAVTLRLPVDLVTLIEAESIADGQTRESGRVYSPSATIERILRTYFAQRPRGRVRSK